MAADARLTAIVDRLIDLFNRQSLDLPDGLFTRHTQFRLNGVPFEEMLGRSPGDPLVLMLARGPAGYRFAAKAVQHADVPTPGFSAASCPNRHRDDGHSSSRASAGCPARFAGRHEPADVLVDVALTLRGATLTHADASIDPRSARAASRSAAPPLTGVECRRPSIVSRVTAVRASASAGDDMSTFIATIALVVLPGRAPDPLLAPARRRMGRRGHRPANPCGSSAHVGVDARRPIPPAHVRQHHGPAPVRRPRLLPRARQRPLPRLVVRQQRDDAAHRGGH